jgi:adenylate/nucleoside-diphosphate kinase
VRNEIDPFYLKADVPDDVRTTADLGEDDRSLPKGDFGDFCPVTYVTDNWLVKGSSENEVTVFGKTYWFAGEKEADLFKLNPTKYLLTKDGRSELPLTPPPPKIMIVGTKGAGVTT